ncbi:MAG TPA: SIR2 family protein [Candidatus Manganitrophaceae bacterium]|nr:SIR2 family protein [Candidatus Manganitrophaceae bacterium]
MSKAVTCLFLGSGASNELAGIPGTSNFLDEVLKEGRDRWIDDAGLTIGNEPLSSWMRRVGDLELCLSYLHQVASGGRRADDPTASQKIPAIQTIINVRAAIAEYLRKIKTGSAQKKLQYQFFNKLISGRENNLIILTTNYDLVIETLLSERRARWCYPEIPIADGGRIFSHRRGGVFERQRGEIPIYKLHGSINWLEERWFERNQPARNIPLKSIHPAEVHVHDLSIKKTMKCIPKKWAYLFTRGRKTYNPILIPFVFQKMDWLEDGRWRDIFQPHWDDAQNSLVGKRVRLFFLGYRLGSADYHMLPWLLMVLGKAKHSEITIITKGQAEDPLSKTDPIREPLERALYPFIDESRIYRQGLREFLSEGRAGDA